MVAFIPPGGLPIVVMLSLAKVAQAQGVMQNKMHVEDAAIYV